MGKRFEKKNADFYQAKFDQYSDMMYRLIVICSILSVVFYSTDVMAFGSFEIKPLIARVSVLPVLVLFSFIYKKYDNYIVRTITAYFMENYIMWSMIWALAYRSERVHAGEGFMIMNVIILSISFAAPANAALAAHFIYMFNIVISHVLFNHYEGFGLMIIITIPCVVGFYSCEREVENQFRIQVMTMNKLESLSHEDYTSKAYSRNIFPIICNLQDDVLTIPNIDKAGMAIIEIDDFKKTVHKYGRNVSDQILFKLSQLLKDAFNSDDYVIRWNSNQFLVIALNKNCSQTYEVIEKLRVGIDASKQFPVHTTVTAGISAYDGARFSETLSRVEDALERAVNAGRNRVSVETLH